MGCTVKRSIPDYRTPPSGSPRSRGRKLAAETRRTRAKDTLHSSTFRGAAGSSAKMQRRARAKGSTGKHVTCQENVIYGPWRITMNKAHVKAEGGCLLADTIESDSFMSVANHFIHFGLGYHPGESGSAAMIASALGDLVCYVQIA